jgi:hypothetical protein
MDKILKQKASYSAKRFEENYGMQKKFQRARNHKNYFPIESSKTDSFVRATESRNSDQVEMEFPHITKTLDTEKAAA